ncbi:MAG: hypothetical protein ACTSQ0_05290 [Candidatus Heimdallarchaeota archaeon]
MTKMKFIKACPFLRDLGDSFLCVNCDKVADVVLDPLIHIEWSEDLHPVASEVEGIETCLFTVEIQENNRLFCISRQQFLEMDNREIVWDDIRDAVILLSLDEQGEFKDTEIDFCSTCLYKVLIASSPAFQKRLDFDEKIRLGTSFILNRANEIHNSLAELSESYAKKQSDNSNETDLTKKVDSTNNKTTSFSWMLWITNDSRFDDEFIANSIEWFQKFDEWGAVVSKIAETQIDEIKIRNVEQSENYAARLKEISYEMVMQLSYFKLNSDEEENDDAIKFAEKIFTMVSIQFEDYIFVCHQFLEIIKNK